MPVFIAAGVFFAAAGAVGLGAILKPANTNSISSRQNIKNDVLQISQQSCIANIETTFANNYIIGNNLTVGGDFNLFTQNISTDASCLMASSMSTTIDNLLEASLNQASTTESSLFSSLDPGINNDVDLEQNISNKLSQINQSICQANVISVTTGNFIYLSGDLGGNVNILSVDTEASSSCIIDNTTNSVIINKESGDSDQDNDRKGAFTALLGIILMIIIFMVVGVIILFSTGALGYIGYKKYKKSKEDIPIQQQPLQQPQQPQLDYSQQPQQQQLDYSQQPQLDYSQQPLQQQLDYSQQQPIQIDNSIQQPIQNDFILDSSSSFI
jgi:hypothetical protein